MFDPFLEVGCFRLANPAFKDETKWPSDVIKVALEEADAETSGSRWGIYKDDHKNKKRRGVFLYAAHWLLSYYPNGAANQANQSATASAQLTSKSVGDESASWAVYTPGSFDEAKEAWFLTTTYGSQYLRLRKRVLMGPLIV